MELKEIEKELKTVRGAEGDKYIQFYLNKCAQLEKKEQDLRSKLGVEKEQFSQLASWALLEETIEKRQEEIACLQGYQKESIVGLKPEKMSDLEIFGNKISKYSDRTQSAMEEVEMIERRINALDQKVEVIDKNNLENYKTSVLEAVLSSEEEKLETERNRVEENGESYLKAVALGKIEYLNKQENVDPLQAIGALIDFYDALTDNGTIGLTRDLKEAMDLAKDMRLLDDMKKIEQTYQSDRLLEGEAKLMNGKSLGSVLGDEEIEEDKFAMTAEKNQYKKEIQRIKEMENKIGGKMDKLTEALHTTHNKPLQTFQNKVSNLDKDLNEKYDDVEKNKDPKNFNQVREIMQDLLGPEIDALKNCKIPSKRANERLEKLEEIVELIPYMSNVDSNKAASGRSQTITVELKQSQIGNSSIARAGAANLIAGAEYIKHQMELTEEIKELNESLEWEISNESGVDSFAQARSGSNKNSGIVDILSQINEMRELYNGEGNEILNDISHTLKLMEREWQNCAKNLQELTDSNEQAPTKDQNENGKKGKRVIKKLPSKTQDLLNAKRQEITSVKGSNFVDKYDNLEDTVLDTPGFEEVKIEKIQQLNKFLVQVDKFEKSMLKDLQVWGKAVEELTHEKTAGKNSDVDQKGHNNATRERTDVGTLSQKLQSSNRNHTENHNLNQTQNHNLSQTQNHNFK